METFLTNASLIIVASLVVKGVVNWATKPKIRSVEEIR